MSTKQFRVRYQPADRSYTAVLFIDAADEDGARRFFGVAFPGRVIIDVKLEPVDPCAQYERRPVRP